MTKLERILLSLLILSFGLRYVDSAWADLIQLMVFPALSLWYGVFGFLSLKTRPLSSSSFLVSVMVGLLLAAAPMGAMFRFQQWPGHITYLLFGLMFSFVALLVLVLLTATQKGKDRARRYRPLIIRTLAWFLFCLILFVYRP